MYTERSMTDLFFIYFDKMKSQIQMQIKSKFVNFTRAAYFNKMLYLKT
jgi:hypothetical protein